MDDKTKELWQQLKAKIDSASKGGTHGLYVAELKKMAAELDSALNPKEDEEDKE